MLAKHLWLFVALTPYRSGALRPDSPLLWRSAARHFRTCCSVDPTSFCSGARPPRNLLALTLLAPTLCAVALGSSDAFRSGALSLGRFVALTLRLRRLSALAPCRLGAPAPTLAAPTLSAQTLFCSVAFPLRRSAASTPGCPDAGLLWRCVTFAPALCATAPCCSSPHNTRVLNKCDFFANMFQMVINHVG